jgi:tetratricopeptide (TPR) repeat protein
MTQLLEFIMPAAVATAMIIYSAGCATYCPKTNPQGKPEMQNMESAIPVVLPQRRVSYGDAVKSINYEKKGDAAMTMLIKSRGSEKEMELADVIIDDYKNALILDGKSEILVHKYCKAVELKYNLLMPEGEKEAERQKAYANTLAMLETLYPGENNTIYADYDKALFLVLNTAYSNIFQVIGVVNRVHALCEKINKEDVNFEDHGALMALGRINFLAPNVPVFIPWPDKKLSRSYLDEALKYNPDSLLVKFFLADTLYAIGEKEKAAVYFLEVVGRAPREDINYFEDRKVRNICILRMKELGIQPLDTICM